MPDILLAETIDHITLITLNRPKQLNALSAELRKALSDIFIALKDDSDTRVVILTGAGRAFSAGMDLKELGEFGLKADHAAGVDLHHSIRDLGKPLIGAINGFAITGGFEIALMCDILIASPAAKFADTHVRMGVVPGWGLSQRLERLIGPSRAKELSFSGNYLDAETAEKWGLVNRVIAEEQLLTHCRQLAADICEADPLTLKTVHQLIDFGNEHTLEEGLAEEKIRNASHQGDTSPLALEQRRQQVTARGRGQLDN